MSGIRYEVADAVARVTLARPRRANALDLPTAEALTEAVARAGSDPQVRVVLLAGEGARFCAGGDVAAMAGADDASQAVLALASGADAALQALDALEKPVVARVQGVVAGAGLALVLAADLVVSARGTRFVPAYTGIGMTPDCGVSWLLPRVVGQQRALEYLLTGRELGADEARDWGLVTRVVDDESLEYAADELARTLAAGPAFALGQTRRLVRSSWDTTRADAGADEARTIARAADHPDTHAHLSRFAGQ